MEGNEFNFEKDYNWAGLVSAIGPEGQLWLQAYAQEQEVRDWIREALGLMRQRQLKPGMELLDRARARWEPLLAIAPGTYHVIGRYYYGALSYYEYCVEDFEGADRTLEKTLESIRNAVEAEPCLLPFSAVALDVPLKQAQIARARGLWDEMRNRLQDVREIVLDRRPMFVLASGLPVYHYTLAAPFAANPPRNGTGEALRYLTNEALRLEVFQQWVEILYALPDFLIPYP
ncbi:MAG TPA: hypothetical protein VGG03_21815 [Thermoanaerobaculia bacterium]